jgi:hypothetical protein
LKQLILVFGIQVGAAILTKYRAGLYWVNKTRNEKRYVKDANVYKFGLQNPGSLNAVETFL